MTEFYELTVAGYKRSLPICPVNETTGIAAFIMLSDVELTIACARELAARSPECGVIFTAECKGIPLAYEMARQMNIPYVVARKGMKIYMRSPVSVDVESITTKGVQKLYISEREAEMLRSRKTLIVDDVISTGKSLKAMETLVERAGGIVAGKCAALAEGDAADRTDIFYLEKLPLFDISRKA